MNTNIDCFPIHSCPVTFSCSLLLPCCRCGFFLWRTAASLSGESARWPALAPRDVGAAQRSSQPDCGQKYSASSHTSWAQPLRHPPGEGNVVGYTWGASWLNKTVSLLCQQTNALTSILRLCVHGGNVSLDVECLSMNTLFFYVHDVLLSCAAKCGSCPGPWAAETHPIQQELSWLPGKPAF